MPDMQGVDGTAVIANNIPKTLDMRGVDGTAVIPRSAPNTPDTRGIDGTAVFGNHTPKSLDETAVIATSKPKMTELWGVDGTAVIADNAPKTPTMRSIDGTAVITTSTPKASDMRGVDGTAVIAQKSPNTSDMRGVHGTAVTTRGTPMMGDVSAFYNHHSDDDGKYEDDGLYPNRPPSSGSPEPNGPEYWQRHLSALSVVKPEPTSTPKKSEADSSCSVKVESDASASQSPPYDRGYGFGAMDTTPYIQPLPSLVNLALRPASSFHNSLVSATAGSDVKMTPSASDASMTPGGTGFQMTSDSQSSVDRSLSLHDVYYCHLCSFVGSNKSDFNDHMATHFEHQCPNCDYTSRTEGRLRRHIKDFHGDPDDSGSRREQGKPKTMRCRQCNYATQDKYEFWNHQRSHIKDEKMLQCPKCPFVTEYKHHLEYHLRNHFGSKPYKCDRCNYSCVNKSMLNSHMKSHTNVYQYRCADCTYATKYCHSLKLHLKKYNHKPATVLNPDGSLPTDGSGDFELVSKRGPPRGPRGPRKDRSPSPGFSPTVARMPPVQMPLPGLMPGMPHGMWPMMPHGAMFPSGFPNPPPLIPVPGMSPLCLQMPSPMLGGMQVRHHLDGGADDGQALFRRYQDLLYAATQHDNGYAKGAALDVPESFNGHHQSAPIQKAEPPKSSRSATPQVAAPEESQKKALVADLAACIEAEARESGECPLDLTTPVHRGSLDQSTDSPQKRKRAEDCTSGSDNDQCEAATGDHNVPRKRSRKGKAYKLDTLCLKLQEKSANSPPDGYESDDYGTDYEGSSPEAGRARTPAEGRHQSETDDPRSTYQNLERKVAAFNGTAPLGAVNRDRAGKRDKEEEKDSGNEDHNSTDNSEHVKEASDEQKLSPSDAKCLYKDALSDRQKMIQTGRVVEPRFAKSVNSIRENDADLGKFDCCHCGIVFQDYVMYMVHMSYHGYSDPFKCNMCGHEAENRFQFFLHIARVAHN